MELTKLQGLVLSQGMDPKLSMVEGRSREVLRQEGYPCVVD